MGSCSHRVTVPAVFVTIVLSAATACKPRQFNQNTDMQTWRAGDLPLTEQEQREAINVLAALEKDTPESRKEVADAIKLHLAPLLSNRSAEAREMRLLIENAIRALTLGGDKLCRDEEKITVFRGHGAKYVNKTRDGKPFVISRYFQRDQAHFHHNLKIYAGPFPQSDGHGDLGDAQNPFSFTGLTSRHTVGIELRLSPFISTANSESSASSFGDMMFTIKMCPGRLPSTANQGWSEHEMLPVFFVLPEEVSNLKQTDSNSSGENPLVSCYAPEIGVGSRAHAKGVDQVSFDDYNRLMFAILEQERQNWAGFLSGFTTNRCNCLSLNRQKNAMYIKDPAHANYLPPYENAMECDGHPGFSPQTIIYVRAKETVLKVRATDSGSLAASEKCLVPQGTSFIAQGLKKEGSHHRFKASETLPSQCSPLSGKDLFIFAEHAFVDLSGG